MRLPNLIIGGVSKAGTTSLFRYLGQHPDVCASDVKEVRYFAPLRFGERPAAVETYAAHFGHCDGQTYVMEATPSYFYGGGTLAREVDQVCESPRVLVSLRDPITRCWSWFQFIKSRTGIPKDMTFGAYLDRCFELHSSGADSKPGNQAYWGLGGGCYARWLPDWEQTFGDRLRVVFFDDLVQAPSLLLSQLFGWLAIDDIVDQISWTVDNRTTLYRYRGLQRVAVRANRRGERFLRRHANIKRRLRGAYYSVNQSSTADSMSAADRARLAQFYEPHNAQLAEQLARLDLTMPSAWSAQD